MHSEINNFLVNANANSDCGYCVQSDHCLKVFNCENSSTRMENKKSRQKLQRIKIKKNICELEQFVKQSMELVS